MQGQERHPPGVPRVWDQERPGMDPKKQLLQKDGARAQEKGRVGACLLLLLVLCSESQGAQTGEAPSISLTLHALNVLTGLPAAGLSLCFSRLEDPNQPWTEISNSTTNTDGRLDQGSLAPQQLKAGTYKLHFDTGGYWQQQGYTSFYPYVEIVFTITEAEGNVHIPLLISPYSYTTYRGS